MPNVSLKMLIKKKISTYNLPNSMAAEIKESTIRARIWKGQKQLTSKGRGISTPLKEVENIVVALIIKIGLI